ncbi:MAG: tyrosine-type recombinase/integrase [Verrucomicrobia bacterium]|nr:tyrosine-type recombinase/integrase [Verrucomicrobiota bacterium]
MTFWDDVFPDAQKTTPNAFVEMKVRPKKTFEPLGEGFARKGNRIYYRVQKNGKATWFSTGTDKLPLARKWKEKWECEQWLRANGVLPKEAPVATGAGITVNALLDIYVEAGHPIIRKRSLRPKAERSIRNEQYCFRPIREFFGDKPIAQLNLNECDRYHRWRLSGGYVAKFLCRSKKITKRTRGGDRSVDLELTFLSNACALGVRRGHLETNPIRDRGRYADESKVRHCREVAPTPEGLAQIVDWMEKHDWQQDADFTRFLAYSGLRLGEAIVSHWSAVDWKEEIIHVRRSKKGVFPFVLLLPELADLLRSMQQRAVSDLMFPSPFDPAKPRDVSAFRRRLGQACKKLGLPHVTPHGMRSYFVTQARQSGLTDAEIAQLIGDKTGPALIAQVYGDVRPDHLLAVARKIKLTSKTRE